MPDHRRDSTVAYSALALLAILLTHLVMMTTPLHELVMHPGRAPHSATMHEAPDGAGTPIEAVVADMHDTGDCAIFWALEPQRSLAVAPAAAGVSAASCTFPSLPYTLPPLPRTLSPPVGGDRQALLQVFRI